MSELLSNAELTQRLGELLEILRTTQANVLKMMAKQNVILECLITATIPEESRSAFRKTFDVAVKEQMESVVLTIGDTDPVAAEFLEQALRAKPKQHRPIDPQP